MGTIRNRMIICHDYNKNNIEKVRENAVQFFQNVVSEDKLNGEFDVSKEMISPIMQSLINSEYTFIINGECSKIGWEASDMFQEKRLEWLQSNQDKCQNIILIDFGEEYEIITEEYGWMRKIESE